MEESRPSRGDGEQRTGSRDRAHELLWKRVKLLPGDYNPWGEVEREDPKAPGGWWPDCSGSCRHYFQLDDIGDEQISFDWGVCTNPASHRCGLLTFEHQGCPRFEYDEEEGERIEAEFEIDRAEALAARALREAALASDGLRRGETLYARAKGGLLIWLLRRDRVALSREQGELGESLQWPWIEFDVAELRDLLTAGKSLLGAFESRVAAEGSSAAGARVVERGAPRETCRGSSETE